MGKTQRGRDASEEVILWRKRNEFMTLHRGNQMTQVIECIREVWMLQCVFGRCPHFWIVRQQLREEIQSGGGDMWELLAQLGGMGGRQRNGLRQRHLVIVGPSLAGRWTEQLENHGNHLYLALCLEQGLV